MHAAIVSYAWCNRYDWLIRKILRWWHEGTEHILFVVDLHCSKSTVEINGYIIIFRRDISTCHVRTTSLSLFKSIQWQKEHLTYTSSIEHMSLKMLKGRDGRPYWKRKELVDWTVWLLSKLSPCLFSAFFNNLGSQIFTPSFSNVRSL